MSATDRCTCRHDGSFHSPDAPRNCTVCGCDEFLLCNHQRRADFVVITDGARRYSVQTCVVCRAMLTALEVRA